MAIYKEYNHTIRITGENRNDEVINLEFQSYDKSVAKLVLDLYSENGLPINLTGATVHFLLVIDENKSIEILGKIEDLPAGKVSMEIPQQIKGYNGRVKCGVYIDFSDGSKIDVKNLVFDLEKSLIDNVDYTPIKGNLFQTFDLALTEIKNYMDNVKQDTVNYADTQKSAMLAKTNEVKAYGDNQKTQIGQVLPDVQSKVSEIKNELAKIDSNMPDLFVAYADNLSGGGFSKSDNSKLFKGYSIKNSTSPADYRWERNIDNWQVGGRNLARGTHGEYNVYEVSSVYQDFNNNVIFTKVYTDGLKIGDTVSYRCILRYTDIVVEDVKYQTNKGIVFLQGNGNVTGWFSGAFAEGPIVEKSVKISGSGEIELKGQFTVTDDMLKNQYWDVRHRVDYVRSGKIERKCFKVEKGNMYTDWSPAPEDVPLLSSPINSILTTLSAENPSTTLGGTWTQLGTESKFNQTIYYWKRTQ